MKPKTKKIINRILKIIWIVIGVLISLWTIYFYLKMNSANGLGIIALVISFTLGFYTLILYVGITLLFLFVKWIIKKIKKRRISHEHKFSGKIKRRKPEVSSQ
mgnify:CR=1 FL=1